MPSCSKDDLIGFIRENYGDCDEPYMFSDSYLLMAIDLAIKQVVNANKTEFTRVQEVILKNASCVQSVCDVCEGVIEIVGNVNGKCESPKEERNDTDKWLAKMYPALCDDGTSEEDSYEIESFDIIGDGGCQFKVTPAVPDEGTFTVNVACVEYPDLEGELPDSVCRHWNEVMFLAMGITYMLEDDRDTLGKADRWFALYFNLVKLENEADRDTFVKSIQFGTRVNMDDE